MHGPQSQLTATQRGNAADWKYLMAPVAFFIVTSEKGASKILS
jgi:hypothetical protein